MHIPGHFAIGLATHRFLNLPGRDEEIPLAPLLAASIFPDVVDKAIGYVFHLMPNGRHYAHNIFAVLVLSLAVTIIWGRAVGLAWFTGYLAHLLADGEGVPWLFPVRKYRFYQGKLKFNAPQIFREMIFLAIVFVAYQMSRR